LAFSWRKGRVKLCRGTREPTSDQGIQEMDRIDDATLRAVRAFVGRISADFPVEKTIVFGSYARGDYTADSDTDVAVVLRGSHLPFLKTKLTMADIAVDVMMETGTLIQPLPIWIDEWEHPESYSNPALLMNIRAEGVEI